MAINLSQNCLIFQLDYNNGKAIKTPQKCLTKNK
jgi:hypothetical protein